MKIEPGSENDSDQCRAIIHEYYKCQDAFNQFSMVGERLVLSGQNNEISYRAYNLYSYFILHLYEFLMACHAREAKNTSITNKRGHVEPIVYSKKVVSWDEAFLSFKNLVLAVLEEIDSEFDRLA